LLKARIVKQLVVAIARRQNDEYISAAKDTGTTMEDAFSVPSIPGLHNEDQLDKSGSLHSFGDQESTDDRIKSRGLLCPLIVAECRF
jgi:hypothetical protein